MRAPYFYPTSTQIEGGFMKKIAFMTIFCILAVFMFSSTGDAADTMVIYYKNGQTQNVDLGNVQRIEFPGGTPQRTSFSSGISSGGTYEFRAKHSGKCLDVAGAATHNSANIFQWECHGGANQRWTVTDKGDGDYLVTARHSNKCMDVENVSNGNGVNISQYDCHAGPNQRWRFIPQGGGYYMVTAKHSGKCLDVAGAGKGNGDNVHQWDCHGGDNQLWQLK